MRCREVKDEDGKGPYPTGVSGSIVEWGAPSDFRRAHVVLWSANGVTGADIARRLHDGRTSSASSRIATP